MDAALRVAHATDARAGFADDEYGIFVGLCVAGRYGHDCRAAGTGSA